MRITRALVLRIAVAAALLAATSAAFPEDMGAPDAPVTDVVVHLHVTAQGAVTNASVVKPVRSDLDTEAIKLVSGWLYDPGICNGRAQEYAIDAVVHFQGR